MQVDTGQRKREGLGSSRVNCHFCSPAWMPRAAFLREVKPGQDGHLLWALVLPCPRSTLGSAVSGMKSGNGPPGATRIPVLPPLCCGLGGAGPCENSGNGACSLARCVEPSFAYILTREREKQEKRLQGHFRIPYVIRVCLIVSSPGRGSMSWLSSYLQPPVQVASFPSRVPSRVSLSERLQSRRRQPSASGQACWLAKKALASVLSELGKMSFSKCPEVAF